ncbi:hypothetical protein M378DRAFT_164081 [Amanita muscaria Koide BX008]|uniref:Uncharacterized protein n=1 Tax=Amanita muscaria (strain Koide BX008) TaxID=946122 RepID=A0A0C2SKC9_AMAMK|nr:hypothetical protein M378DRAFT_164081 [Amanita muscaria Koide BX008]
MSPWGQTGRPMHAIPERHACRHWSMRASAMWPPAMSLLHVHHCNYGVTSTKARYNRREKNRRHSRRTLIESFLSHRNSDSLTPPVKKERYILRVLQRKSL